MNNRALQISLALRTLDKQTDDAPFAEMWVLLLPEDRRLLALWHAERAVIEIRKRYEMPTILRATLDHARGFTAGAISREALLDDIARLQLLIEQPTYDQRSCWVLTAAGIVLDAIANPHLWLDEKESLVALRLCQRSECRIRGKLWREIRDRNETGWLSLVDGLVNQTHDVHSYLVGMLQRTLA